MPDIAQVPVALLYPSDATGMQVRETLARYGAPIVYETITSAADRDALEQSGAQVIVVNLDADVDACLGDIKSLLDESRCRIVFNDAEVSSGLTGWDAARWERHLLAKIRGDGDAHPPRPAGAQPVPPRRQTAVAADADSIASAEVSGFDAAGFSRVSDAAPVTIAVESDGPGFTEASGAVADPDPVAPEIEQRTTQPSDAPDFEGWNLDEFAELPPLPPAPREDVGDARDFGVDIIDPAEFLAPVTEPFDSASDAFELELVPLEDTSIQADVTQAEHEVWFDSIATEAQRGLRHVWILAAATGGPQAVRSVLSALPENYPAVFLLVQHMGADFMDVMLDQLAGSTPLRLRRAKAGYRAAHGDVVIMPVDQEVSLDERGNVTVQESGEPARVGDLIRQVADTFASRAGLIVFSGMPTDLLDSVREFRERGAAVWAQDPQTCLVGALAEAASDAGLVDFSGAPGDIAERLQAIADLETARG